MYYSYGIIRNIIKTTDQNTKRTVMISRSSATMVRITPSTKT